MRRRLRKMIALSLVLFCLGFIGCTDTPPPSSGSASESADGATNQDSQSQDAMTLLASLKKRGTGSPEGAGGYIPAFREGSPFRRDDAGVVTGIDITNTPATDDNIAKIVDEFPHVTKFLASNTKLTDAGVAHLAKLDELTELIVWHNEIGDESLESLKSMKNLKLLSITATKFTPDGVAEFMEAVPECKVFYEPPAE